MVIYNTKKQISKLAMFICAFFFPLVASAHVKWFIAEDSIRPLNFIPYSLGEMNVLIWMAIGTLLILTAIVLEKILPEPPAIIFGLKNEVISILRIFTGMSLMLTAYEGNIIAPHLPAVGALGVVLVLLQGIIGILFITERFVFHAAAIMLVFFLGATIQNGLITALEYSHLIGIALFFLITGLSKKPEYENIKSYAVPILRVITGIALVTLGLTEKLVGTGAILGQSFIAEYQWNFMTMAGFDWFDDRLFVLSAGSMEVVFGTILTLGVITRLNTFVLSVFLLTSNIVFLVIGDNSSALMELVGHMPLIGSALVFLIFGSGDHLKITNLWKRKS